MIIVKETRLNFTHSPIQYSTSASYVFYSYFSVVTLYIGFAIESGVELITRYRSISRFMILTPLNIDKIDITQPLTHRVHLVQIKADHMPCTQSLSCSCETVACTRARTHTCTRTRSIPFELFISCTVCDQLRVL